MKKDYNLFLTTPFETGIKKFDSIAKFFLYYAPNIDSAQSIIIPYLDCEEIFEKLIEKVNLKHKFKVLKKIQPSSWNSLDLDTNEIDFENSRRIYSKRT